MNEGVYNDLDPDTGLAEPEPHTPEEVGAYLRKHGRDPDLVGRWGKAVADAAIYKAKLVSVVRFLGEEARQHRNLALNGTNISPEIRSWLSSTASIMEEEQDKIQHGLSKMGEGQP